ncbi:siderophore-interacting protein [Streptomyces sp. NBC_01318]|nr:siderophore-interacting protein [Streptomyces sp. NBC_01318]
MGPGLRVSRRTRASYRRLDPVQQHAETDGDAAAGAAWPAGESGVVRALRRHLVEERRPARPTVEFSGYWRRALTRDGAPTEEDLAWAKGRAEGFGSS